MDIDLGESSEIMIRRLIGIQIEMRKIKRAKVGTKSLNEIKIKHFV
ncbi:hypothetical protein HY988_06320 [Candidatus Micrarchaeota archaeon]|nr:hypothetical protein [Candidatus Micrarchaeota archaeon]